MILSIGIKTLTSLVTVISLPKPLVSVAVIVDIPGECVSMCPDWSIVTASVLLLSQWIVGKEEVGGKISVSYLKFVLTFIFFCSFATWFVISKDWANTYTWIGTLTINLFP